MTIKCMKDRFEILGKFALGLYPLAIWQLNGDPFGMQELSA